MLADYHLHSNFSGDCQVPMKDMIEGAIQNGVNRLCFTEHHDLDFPHPTLNFELDIPRYLETIRGYQEDYKHQIQILIGIELGMQIHLHEKLNTLVSSADYDFVLASSHLANGIDPYDKIFFEGRSQHKAYLDYFEAILANIKGYNNFDVYGHLDYVIRKGDNDKKAFVYEDFKEILDEILKLLIKKDKGIELNTSGYRYGLNNPHPTTDILKHYHDLGGQILTIGSDAHHPKHLLSHFDTSKDLLKSLGFTQFTTFVKRQPEFHKL